MKLTKLDHIIDFINNVKYGYEVEFPENTGVFIKLSSNDYSNFIDNFEALISPLSSKQSLNEIVPGITELKYNNINILIGKDGK